MKESQSENEAATQRIVRLLSLITFFLIFLVQLFLYLAPVEDAVVIPRPVWFGMGGIAILLIAIALHPSPLFLRLFSKITIGNRALAIIFSIGFSILAVLGSYFFDKTPRSIYIPISTFWFLSAACFIGAFYPRSYSSQELVAFIKRHRSEFIAVGAVTFLAVVLRMVKLGQIPFVINGDEGWIGMTAQNSNSGDLANPFALWENFGAIYIHGIRDAIRLFGANSFALRLLPAVGGVLAIPSVYLLARQIAGKYAAFFSAFLLACSHAHINYSRTVAVAYIQGTWLIPLELFFLLRGLKKRNSCLTAVSGALLAIHFCIYLSAQVVTALVLVFMLILAIFYRSWFKTIYKQFMVFWSSFMIVFLPELFYIARYPDQFFNRLNVDGSIQSGWVTEQVLTTGKSAVVILIERVAHAFLSLIYYPSIDFYGTQAPVLTFFSAVLFLIGLGITLYRTKKVEFLLLNGYFWAMTLAVGIFALPPSADSYRMLSVLPAVVIMAAIGMHQVLETIGVRWDWSRLKYGLVVGITLFSILGSNLWIYFLDFAGQCKYGDDLQTRYSTHLGYFLATIDREADVYLLSDESIFYGQNKTVDYLSGSIAVTNVSEAVDTINSTSGAVVIAIPDRREELQQWAQTHPGGEFVFREDCRKTILTAYILP